MRARPLALALYGVLAAALIAGPVAYVLSEKSVTLDVDGQVSTVQSYAGTVGELLHQQDVRFDNRDVVSPSPAERLQNGERIAVVNARPVTITIDGTPVAIWTTAQTVAELSSSFGVRFEDAYLSTSRSTRIPLSGLSLSARMPKAVTVVDAGHRTALVTTAATWAQVLSDAGIAVSAQDLTSLDPSSAPTDGAVDTITRITLSKGQRLVRVQYPIVHRPSALLYVGTSKVVQQGHFGGVLQTWHYTYKNGKQVAATMVSSKQVSPAISEIVAVGTKARPVATVTQAPVAKTTAPTPTKPPATSVDSLDWSALAQCESGGNPQAVGGGGLYFGLYQFMVSTWQAMGGSGNPINASAAEQTYRAKLLYLRSGAGSWPYCGQFLFK